MMLQPDCSAITDEMLSLVLADSYTWPPCEPIHVSFDPQTATAVYKSITREEHWSAYPTVMKQTLNGDEFVSAFPTLFYNTKVALERWRKLSNDALSYLLDNNLQAHQPGLFFALCDEAKFKAIDIGGYALMRLDINKQYIYQGVVCLPDTSETISYNISEPFDPSLCKNIVIKHTPHALKIKVPPELAEQQFAVNHWYHEFGHAAGFIPDLNNYPTIKKTLAQTTRGVECSIMQYAETILTKKSISRHACAPDQVIQPGPLDERVMRQLYADHALKSCNTPHTDTPTLLEPASALFVIKLGVGALAGLWLLKSLSKLFLAQARKQKNTLPTTPLHPRKNWYTHITSFFAQNPPHNATGETSNHIQKLKIA